MWYIKVRRYTLVRARNEKVSLVGISGHTVSVDCLDISCVLVSLLWDGIFLFSIVIDDTYMLMTRTKIHVTITKINVHKLTQSLKIKLWQHTCVYEINHLQVYFICTLKVSHLKLSNNKRLTLTLRSLKYSL